MNRATVKCAGLNMIIALLEIAYNNQKFLLQSLVFILCEFFIPILTDSLSESKSPKLSRTLV